MKNNLVGKKNIFTLCLLALSVSSFSKDYLISTPKTSFLFSAEKGRDILLHEALDLNNFKHAEKIPRFLVLCPPKMHPDYQKNIRTLTNFGQEGYHMIETMALQLQPVCQKWKVDFKELDNIIAGSFDGLHLDETGHQKIAEQLLLILEDYR